MEKLILTCEVGDGCCWSRIETTPFLYESLEKARKDLSAISEKAIKEWKEFDKWQKEHSPFRDAKDKRYDQEYIAWFLKESTKHYSPTNFKFVNLDFDIQDTKNIKIETLEEWFKKHLR